LSTGSLSLTTGAHFVLQLGGTTGEGTAGTLYDELKVAGSVTLGGDAQISLSGYTPAVGDTFYAILNDGTDAVTGTFSNAVSNVITSGGWEYTVNYAANGDGGSVGNDVSLTALAAVPEASTGVALASGLLMLSWWFRAQGRRIGKLESARKGTKTT
jgi:hypothetical protein